MASLTVSSKQKLLKTAILGLIAGAAFSSRLFSIVRYESVIHEFDPWFNYRATRMFVEKGVYDFWNWFDDRSWYPLGRVVGGTVYPGLMVTAAAIHNVLHYLHFPVDIRNVCVLLAPLFSGATAAATYLLTKELKDSGEKKKPKKQVKAKAPVDPPTKKKQTSAGIPADASIFVVLSFAFFLIVFVWHCTWATASAYSSPSIVLSSRNADGSQHIIDDFREAYYWLRKNTKEDAKIMSWWDYGYQIAGMADRTTLVDNNTWNNTHIATVGRAMASNEKDAYEIMKKHDVDYVLVIFGGLLGYSGDDINKYLWMIRIAAGVWPDKVKESAFFSSTGGYNVDEQASPTMRDSLMYKMSYYRFNEVFGGQQGFDRVRQQRLPLQGPDLSVLDEAFTSENWIVRIYKVKDYDNLGRSHHAASEFETGKKKKKQRQSKKSRERRRRAMEEVD